MISGPTDENSACVEFKYYGRNDKYTIIVTLGEADDYEARLDGREIPFVKRTRGAVEITLGGEIRQGTLTVIKKSAKENAVC